MTLFLLDANVLIALVTQEHVHHERAASWAAGVDRFALCPVVEGAFIRFATRLGASAADAQEALRIVRRRRGFEFLPESLSYTDVDLGHVHGHNQVTDAYLAALAASQPEGKLVTLDEGLASDLPGSTVLLP